MFSKAEIVDILKDDTNNEWLFSYADKIREENVGNKVHLRALIEFSNICKSSCKYCGLRFQNKKVQRYRIAPDEIIGLAKKAADSGFKTVVLQSGEDCYYKKEILTSVIKEIKKFDVALTLSIGERSYEDYKAFYEAGADRYLIRIETSDKNLYKALHPNMSFENRLRCLNDLKKLGYEVGTGCLCGLPNQTIESLADDILFFKQINADMIGIGPFIAHPSTPLKDSPNGSFELALKTMALTRIMLPDINIPATTAMESICPNGQIKALKSGANVIMLNVTSDEYKNNYEIYPNKVHTREIASVEEKIKSIGRYFSGTKGFRGEN